MFGRDSKRIGITLDQTGVRYVLLKKKSKSWVVEKSGFLPIPEGIIVEDQIIETTLLSNQLKLWIKNEGLIGASSTIAVPTSQIIIRRMQIQTTNPKELPQLVELEVETALHLPFEDPIYDYVKVGTDEVSTQLFIYAAPKKLINTYSMLLENAGVKVTSAELSATALARAITLQHEEKFTDTMLISMDEKVLEIYMFHDGYPIFMRDMSLEDNGEDIVKGELSIEQVREISAEISRMLNFYQYSIYEGLSRITSLIVTGSTEGKQQLLSGLQQTLPDTMDIRTIDFTSLVGESTDAVNVDDYRIAMGLALHEKNENSISLLPHSGREEKLRSLVMSGVLAVWILIAALMGYLYYDNHLQIQKNIDTKLEQSNQMTILEAKFSADKKDTGSETNPQSIVDDIKSRIPNILTSLNEITAIAPSGANNGKVSYNNFQFILTINFNKIEDTAKYLYDLRALKSVESAKIQSIAEDKTANKNTSANDLTDNSVIPATTTKYSVIYDIKLKKLKRG